MHKIGVISHPHVDPKPLQKIVKQLSDARFYISLDPVAASKLNSKGTEITDMVVDLVITLGGDGTLLWAVKELRSDPLVLGINAGRFGYLTELNLDNASYGLNLLIDKKFHIDERSKLKVNRRFEALNEVSIFPLIPASLLEFKVNVNSHPLMDFRADGVVVSTQTGSTGHSLSLGGPIITPDTRAWTITPANSFMGEQKSIVIPDDSKISIQLLREDRGAYLVVDGHVIEKLHFNDTVLVEKSDRTVKFVRFNDLDTSNGN